MLNKQIFVLMLLVGFIISACSQDASKSDIKTDMDKASYAIGYDIGESLKAENLDDVNLDILLLGMREAKGDGEPALDEEARMLALNYFQQEMMRRQQERITNEGAENLELGNAFLENNAQKDGVVVTESGLQYRVLQEGSGRKPSSGDRVTVHYRGSLIDGTQFDSSYDRGEPATFGVTQVIAGWTEGLQLMSVGSKYELTIPADLAYGPQGRPGAIPPNAVLVFEVELLGIN